MTFGVVVAAGGRSTRFLSGLNKINSPKHPASADVEIPSKLWFDLHGQPVLSYSLKLFQQMPEIGLVCLCVPPVYLQPVRKWVHRNNWLKVHVMAGGETRSLTVLKGVRYLKNRCAWVLVHDGARPMITSGLVQKLLKHNRKNLDGLILARKSIATLKKANPQGMVDTTVDRSMIWEAETPQLINLKRLLEAYAKCPNADQATDEANLIEWIGGRVKVVETGAWNPKITGLEDLNMAEKIMQKSMIVKTGFGEDLHRLAPGRPLWLGGIKIPSPIGAIGHSDGDALLHAVTDAILGVLSAGDIGDWFSDKDPKWKNIQSSKLLKLVLEKAQKENWQIEHVDTVVHLERPKLAGYKEKIGVHLAKLLKVEPSQVSVKAKTGEKLGPIGEGLAVAARALVTMKRNST